MKMELFKKNEICALRKKFRLYAHAIRFAFDLHSTKKFHPIVKYKHYQISSGSRASLFFHKYDSGYGQGCQLSRI